MSVTEIALIAGRVLFALLFISSGINHFAKGPQMIAYAQFKKIPLAKVAVYVTGLMLVLGGMYILLGFYADLGALLLAVFLVPTAFLMHAFWKESDATAKQSEMILFFKDLSLAGAALIIFALLRGGADFGENVGTLLFFS